MRPKYYKQFFAKDLAEAYSLGYFGSTMSFSELKERVEKYNPTLSVKTNSTHRGIFDGSKTKFICGIPKINSIPQWNLFRWDKSQDKVLNHYNDYGEVVRKEIVNTDDNDSVMLARGWEGIFDLVEANGYKVDRFGL